MGAKVEAVWIQVRRAKPFIAVIFLQIGFAGMDVLSKVALNHGISNYVLVVYRHAFATIFIAPFSLLHKNKSPPKMTLSIFSKLALLAFLEPVADQNLYYLGMKYTSATFAATMTNVLPAATFFMAYFFGMEKLKLRSRHSQAKVIGTLATVAGAMVMTLVKGPHIPLFSNGDSSSPTNFSHSPSPNSTISIHDAIKGSALITAGCFCWAFFIILQTITLRSYPCELSLTAWVCFLGTLEGGAVALVMERGHPAAWSVGFDSRLAAAIYSGVVCSGLAYYIQGVVMVERGPVFVTAFSPFCMVVVAAISATVLAEQLHVGRVVGAVVIVAGLYMVVWGKSRDCHQPGKEEEEEEKGGGRELVVVVPVEGQPGGGEEV